MSAVANSAGIYVDGALNCKIERNEVFNCGVGLAVGAEQNTATGNGGQSTGHIVNNNSVYNNVVTGAIFGGVIGSGYTTSVGNTKIYNNTFYKNRTGAVINGVTTIGGIAVGTIADIYGGEVHLQNSSGITFKNNILYATTGKKALLASYGYTVSGFVSNYNLFYREGNTDFIIDLTGVSFNGSSATGSYNQAQFATATGQDVNSVVGVPGFVNAALFDFTLATGAFAADKGDPTYNATYSGTLDFDDDIRKRNGRIDIGCSELQTGSTAKKAATVEVTEEIAPGYAVFPNPASDQININFGKDIQSVTISVLDLNGRVLLRETYNATNSATINVSDLKKSQFVILHIDADNKISNNKIYLK